MGRDRTLLAALWDCRAIDPRAARERGGRHAADLERRDARRVGGLRQLAQPRAAGALHALVGGVPAQDGHHLRDGSALRRDARPQRVSGTTRTRCCPNAQSGRSARRRFESAGRRTGSAARQSAAGEATAANGGGRRNVRSAGGVEGPSLTVASTRERYSPSCCVRALLGAMPSAACSVSGATAATVLTRGPLA